MNYFITSYILKEKEKLEKNSLLIQSFFNKYKNLYCIENKINILNQNNNIFTNNNVIFLKKNLYKLTLQGENINKNILNFYFEENCSNIEILINLIVFTYFSNCDYVSLILDKNKHYFVFNKNIVDVFSAIKKICIFSNNSPNFVEAKIYTKKYSQDNENCFNIFVDFLNIYKLNTNLLKMFFSDNLSENLFFPSIPLMKEFNFFNIKTYHCFFDSQMTKKNNCCYPKAFSIYYKNENDEFRKSSISRYSDYDIEIIISNSSYFIKDIYKDNYYKYFSSDFGPSIIKAITTNKNTISFIKCEYRSKQFSNFKINLSFNEYAEYIINKKGMKFFLKNIICWDQ